MPVTRPRNISRRQGDDGPTRRLAILKRRSAGSEALRSVTAVGFEPTPFRNGALSHRLRPLGQTVLSEGKCHVLNEGVRPRPPIPVGKRPPPVAMGRRARRRPCKFTYVSQGARQARSVGFRKAAARLFSRAQGCASVPRDAPKGGRRCLQKQGRARVTRNRPHLQREGALWDILIAPLPWGRPRSRLRARPCSTVVPRWTLKGRPPLRGRRSRWGRLARGPRHVASADFQEGNCARQ